jgi:hypothetical protein
MRPAAMPIPSRTARAIAAQESASVTSAARRSEGMYRSAADHADGTAAPVPEVADPSGRAARTVRKNSACESSQIPHFR